MKRLRRLLLLLVLGFIVLLFLRSALGGGVAVESGSTLVVGISGEYIEAAQPSLLARVLGDGSQPFLSLLSTVKLAERDARIETVVFHIRDVALGWGKAAEIRSAIARLRAAGRKTIAYLEVESFSVNRAYYIATAAEEIYVIPGAVVPLVGLSAEYLYFGQMWEKLGIEIEATKVGKYKSAVETLTDRGMSEASREVSNALLDATERRFVSAISEARGLPVAQVRAIIDEGLVRSTDLLDRGLIDGIEHFAAIVDSNAKRIDADEYVKVDPATTGFDPKIQMALVYGSGLVVSGLGSRSPSGAPVFASHAVAKALEDAAANPDISGIVLRIDSPGGSPLASEVMWAAVQRVREGGTPVVVSVSDVAASGGYYVASAADAIVIAPGSVTGSIGVFAVRPVFEELMEKIGISSESLQRGRHADFLFTTRNMSDETRARMQTLATDIYRVFLERVAIGRGLDVEQVDTLGQGRVWSAEQALQIGLVDELGGLRDAVNWILRDLELDEGADVSLVTYPEAPTLTEEIAKLLQSGTLPGGRGAVSPINSFLANIPLPRGFTGLRDWLLARPSGGFMLLPTTLIEIR